MTSTPTTRKPAAKKASPRKTQVTPRPKTTATKTPRTAKPKTAPAVKVIEPGPTEIAKAALVDPDDPAYRDVIATEKAAVKAWNDMAVDARKGKTAPKTPNLDALIKSGKPGPKTTRTPKGDRTPRAPKVPGEYTRNGNPVPAGRGVSYLAWSATKDMPKKGSPRCGVADLVKALAKLGVDDPETGTWEVTLPNGQTIGRKG